MVGKDTADGECLLVFVDRLSLSLIGSMIGFFRSSRGEVCLRACPFIVTDGQSVTLGAFVDVVGRRRLHTQFASRPLLVLQTNSRATRPGDQLSCLSLEVSKE